MRFLNDIVENGELEVDHCPWKFITPDAITKNTRVHKIHADTIYNGHILLPDYNRSIDRSNREDVNIVLEVRDNEHGLMCPTDRGNDPTVDNDETERVDRERGRDGNGQLHDGNGDLHNGNGPLHGTSGRWYRTHAQRERRETE
jgi:hypothetical protein